MHQMVEISGMMMVMKGGSEQEKRGIFFQEYYCEKELLNFAESPLGDSWTSHYFSGFRL